jgi:hypothetical protein
MDALTAICVRDDEPGNNAEGDEAKHCCGVRKEDSEQSTGREQRVCKSEPSVC